MPPGDPTPVMPEPAGAERATLELRDYLNILKARRWEILAVTAVVLAASLAMSVRQPDRYEGRVRLLVKTVPGAIAGSNLKTEQSILVSRDVTLRAVAKPESPTDVAEEIRRNTTSEVAGSNLLDVVYTDTSPSKAIAGARAISSAYLDNRRAVAQQAVDDAKAAVEQQIEDTQTLLDDLDEQLDDAPPESTLASTLENQRTVALQRLVGLVSKLSDLEASPVRKRLDVGIVLDPGRAPPRPSSPNLGQAVGLGLGLGILLGLAVAFVRERLDDLIKTRAGFERHAGGPVVAAVPRFDDARGGLVTITDPSGAASEAYRTLRTNLQFASDRHDVRVILVTSPIGPDGKSVTASNLAIAFAQAGRQAVLVSCDLRHPKIHELFGLGRTEGLAEVLSRDVPLDSALRQTEHSTLRVLPSGEPPEHPAELLVSPEMGKVIEQLRTQADVVVLDVPPVLAVADASILAPQSDGVLFVLDVETASRAEVDAAREQLSTVGAGVLGVVLNRVEQADDAGSSRYHARYEARFRSS